MRRLKNGDRCNTCVGRGLCIVCNGDGEMPLGSKAHVEMLTPRGPASPARQAKLVGRYAELGFEGAPSLLPLVRTGSDIHRAKSVAYLRGGKTLVLTTSLLRDAFDSTRTPGSRSLLTDGTFAWSAGLAYYVERYGLPVPPELEAHMARQAWTVPAPIDLRNLSVSVSVSES
jgi:hypothetical protein